MPIEFACDCGKQLRVADQHAGKRAKCPACGQPVTVPTPIPVSETLSAEDEAFRALSEGPDPEPAGRGWQSANAEPAPPPKPRPVLPPSKADTYAALSLSKTAPIPKPKKSKLYDDPYAAPERKWNVDWGQVGGGIVGILVGGGLLIGGLAAGRFFIWSPIILGAGVIGVVNGLFNKS